MELKLSRYGSWCSDRARKRLDVDKEQIIGVFTRFPPLAFQKPERLIAAVNAGAARLGWAWTRW